MHESQKEDSSTPLNVAETDPAVKRPFHLASVIKVDMGALSHVGKVRKNNEDHYLVARLGRVIEPLFSNLPDEDLPTNLSEYGYGMLVADGMGGQAAGEVASRLASTMLLNLVGNAGKWASRIDDAEAKSWMERMEGYYNTIHAALIRQAENDPAFSGMGTTLTVSYSFSSDLFIAHVGDSRAYLFRKGDLYRLTRDHTLAQAMADRGEITCEEIKGHRFRNVLTNALGGQVGPIQIELQRFQLMDKDRLLLCSDGLTDMVDDAAIVGVLNRTSDSKIACREFLDLALDAGGKDNITVLVASYSIPEISKTEEGSE